jgi:8-oxo-dGTP diphosphatase
LSGPVPRFGRRLPGIGYPPRPGAYALVFNERGEILAVEEGGYWWLPGGGVEAGETHEQGLIREMLEETGYAVEILREIGRANEFTQDPINKQHRDKQCRFYAVRLLGESKGPQLMENTPHWLAVADALTKLYDETHRWAVKRTLDAGGR